MIGATTENPSFEINAALLSRVRVFVLKQIAVADIRLLIQRALSDTERGLGARRLTIDEDALDTIATQADGDARRALTVIEAAADHTPDAGAITFETAKDALQQRVAKYDKRGEETFNMLSAFHKSTRFMRTLVCSTARKRSNSIP